MSSALRSLSQIPVRSKFLIALADASDAAVAFTGEWVGSVTESLGTIAAHDLAAGAIYRDLGRQMMLVDTDGTHLALYREAMPQTNADAEGAVLGDASVWLCVWDAAGASVKVARLG